MAEEYFDLEFLKNDPEFPGDTIDPLKFFSGTEDTDTDSLPDMDFTIEDEDGIVNEKESSAYLSWNVSSQDSLISDLSTSSCFSAHRRRTSSHSWPIAPTTLQYRKSVYSEANYSEALQNLAEANYSEALQSLAESMRRTEESRRNLLMIQPSILTPQQKHTFELAKERLRQQNQEVLTCAMPKNYFFSSVQSTMTNGLWR